MVGFGNWADAHAHLADERWEVQGPQVQDEGIAEALQKGIGFFLQGGVDPADWIRQKNLKSRHPQRIGLCFGLHPYFVASHSNEQCEQALDVLAPLIAEAQALGEMGLDFRPHIMKDSRERQIEFFENQLELADATQKPVVLHLVQAHEETLKILDVWGVPRAKGFVHSFNGSVSKAQELIRRGLSLSVGGPLCRPDNHKLHQAVKEVPLEFLLLETDSPDQPPPLYENQLNPPASLWEVARAVGELKSLDPSEILDVATANLRRLVRWS